MEKRTNSRYAMDVLGKGTLGTTDTEHAGIFREMSGRVADSTRRQELELVKIFREMGVTVNEIDTAPFSAAVRPALISGFFPWGKTIYDRLQEIP